MKYAPRPYQQTAIDAIRSKWRSGKRRIVLVAPTGSGKCLGRGTPVLMFDGRILSVEAVRTGDLLMGPDSRSRTVRSVTEGFGDLYRVVPLKGDPWICNRDHILSLVHTETGIVEDVPVQRWLSETNCFRHRWKQFMVGVDYGKNPDLPIDPYFLGLWIGDGSKSTGRLGLLDIRVTKPDPEVEACVREVASRWSLRVTVSFSNRCPTWSIVTEIGGRNPLLDAMRSVVGPDVEVPLLYLTATRQQRLQLLAGWIDSDGYANRSCVEVTQKNTQHADAFCQLCRSLGFRVTRVEKYVNGNPYQRMQVSGDLSVVPTRLPRKKIRPPRHSKDATRTGFSIEAIGAGPYFGFEIDGDRRFLLGDFTVTHNTAMASTIIDGAVKKGNKVLFLAHRKELIEQCSQTLDEMGVDHGVIKASHWRRRLGCPVQVASVQTLVSKRRCVACKETPDAECTTCKGERWVRSPLPEAQIVIIDEAHRCLARTYREILTEYPNALRLGLTATPWRLDRKGLHRLYEDMVETIQVQQLVEEGYLLPVRAYAPDLPDLSDVKTKAGDYDASELSAIMGADKLVGNIVEHWKKLGENRRTVVFAASVENSLHLVDRFKEAGVVAEHLDGSTPELQRDAILGRLASGETRVCCNVDVLVEGYDLPSLGCVVLARPTKSLTRFLQQVGRGMRPYEDQQYMILIDHAGCVHEHGLPTEPRRWTLDDRPKKKKRGDGFIPEGGPCVQCESCGALRPANTAACPACAGVQTVMFRGILHEREEDLVELAASRYPCDHCDSHNVRLSPWNDLELRVDCRDCGKKSFAVDKIAAKQASTDRRRVEFDRLRKIQQARDYKPGWVSHQYRHLFGSWPPPEWRGS